MKPLIQFARMTLLGGVFFLLPIAALAILLDKAIALAAKFAKPLAKQIPETWNFGVGMVTLLSIGLLVLICFLAGLFARTKLAQQLVGALESSILGKIPGYFYVKRVSASMLGFHELAQRPVVLAHVGGAWRIGIQMEGETNGLVTVFLPDAPHANSGTVCFLTPDGIKIAGVSTAAAANCLERFGDGSGALFGAKFR
jgi:uncharacterized membrane protein